MAPAAFDRIDDTADVVCLSRTPTRDVLNKLNQSVWLFYIVVDDDGRVVGTLTDGDVRRGILAGGVIDEPIEKFMYRDATKGIAGDDRGNAELLRMVPFLPIVDENGCLVEVLAPKPGPKGPQTALVMAGGKGSRLGAATKSTPKPLLKVGQKPILGHILDDLAAAGVQNRYVSAHYLADQIDAFVGDREDKEKITVIHEDTMLGTAGVLNLLPNSVRGPILVVNGDVMTRIDYVALDAFHRRHEYDATIAVAQYEVEVPYGVIRYSADGQFDAIDEKPVTRHFVAAGIYYLATEFCSLVPPGRQLDMPELLNIGRASGMRIGLFPLHEYWRDVGYPEDLAGARKDHDPN